MSIDLSGPKCYINLRAAYSGEDWNHISEYSLYTETVVTSELSNKGKPIELINTVPTPDRKFVGRAAIILRVWDYYYHLLPQIPDWSKTDDTAYHGGNEADEIAALISLCLGIRVKQGGLTRMFGRDDDPKGRPMAMDTKNPFGSFIKQSRGWILPSALEHRNLEDAEIIFSIDQLSVEDATALIRAARMYQEAIWIVESSPELTWLLLTSAVETIANEWQSSKATSDEKIEQMRRSMPKLEKILDEYDDALVSKVADVVADYVGATAKFRNFLLEFLPPAPSERIYPHFQIKWERKAIKKILSKIYDYRSKALHKGIPFPAPMCEPPSTIKEDYLVEIPNKLGVSMKGNVWVGEDIPILLHTFEYIARNAILSWWRSIISDENSE